MNVQQLRQTAKQRYDRGQGQRNLKGYSRLGKAALLSKLGLHDEARAHKSQATRRKAIAFNATKEGGDSSVRKAQVKGRILRSIKRSLTAKEKSLGRELTQQEKRAIAAKALAVEVKAIRSGKPEMKPKRGNAQNLKPAVKKESQVEHKKIELPELEGSEKQVSWASDIREKLIEHFKEHLAWTQDRIDSVERKGRSSDRLKQSIKDARRDLRIVLDVTDSQFWIKNKNFSTALSEPAVDSLKGIALVFKWTRGYPDGIPENDALMAQISSLQPKKSDQSKS